MSEALTKVIKEMSDPEVLAEYKKINAVIALMFLDVIECMMVFVNIYWIILGKIASSSST